MKPTENQIREIAELLDCGELCFFHQPTGTIEHHPDPADPYFEHEPWQELIDKIQTDWSNYLKFEKMSSRQGFQSIADFAESLNDENFQADLFKLLTQTKPFGKFKWAIDNSQHRQKWFRFQTRGIHQVGTATIGRVEERKRTLRSIQLFLTMSSE